MIERTERAVLDAIAELEALESPDEIDRTVLWQIREGRERGRVGAEVVSFETTLGPEECVINAQCECIRPGHHHDPAEPERLRAAAKSMLDKMNRSGDM